MRLLFDNIDDYRYRSEFRGRIYNWTRMYSASGVGTFRLEPEPGYEVLAPGSGSSLAEIEQILDAILLFSSNVDKRQIKKQML